MDPHQECPFPACSSRQSPARIPHETNLILTVSAGASRLLQTVNSRSTQRAAEKGPLIAGF